MRRVSQQIGWSQEAKLYYEWLMQLERLTAILGKGNVPTTTTTTTTNPALCVINPRWATTNLNVTTYANGDPIPEVQDGTAWSSLTTGAWCSYDNDPANDAIYGKIYNGYAVNDPRGLAPIGYHIPTLVEFQTLVDCLGGESIAGGKLKEAGTSHWASPNTGATNSSGFTALPGGYRESITGTFNNIEITGGFWSATDDMSRKWFIYLGNSLENAILENDLLGIGLSVRVIADPTSIKIKWNDIANVPVTNVLNVGEWNTLFDLPTNGVPFTHVFIDPMDANTIVLANGSNIYTADYLFDGNPNILSFVDEGSVVSVGYFSFTNSNSLLSFSSTSATSINTSFYSSSVLNSVVAPLAATAGNNSFSGTALTSIDLPSLLTAGSYCFNNTYSATSVNLPALTDMGQYGLRQCGLNVTLSSINLSSCTNLGGTVGNNNVFNNITGQTITLTVPAALMTCNGGNPDGDIIELQSYNTVTIVTV